MQPPRKRLFLLVLAVRLSFPPRWGFNFNAPSIIVLILSLKTSPFDLPGDKLKGLKIVVCSKMFPKRRLMREDLESPLLHRPERPQFRAKSGLDEFVCTPQRDAPRYPRPQVTADNEDPPESSVFELLRSSWRNPHENLGVICIMSVCLIGFIMTRFMQAPQSSSEPTSLTPLLLSEIHALRAEVAALRTLLQEWRDPACKS
ncbi:hypothetical protein Ae201684P_000086 [Aphanomyces euteiches]|nr:hypothetical protein Ae201684P_000086 [Aphanomyces euteiches]